MHSNLNETNLECSSSSLLTLETDLGPVQAVERNCPNCGASNENVTALPYVDNPWSIKQCGKCDLVYLTKAAVYEALASDISWEKTVVAEFKRRRKTRPINHRLSTWFRFRLWLIPKRTMKSKLIKYAPPGKVVDIGCGSASHMLDFPDSFTPYGVEISQELAKQAQQNLGTRNGSAVNLPALDGLKELTNATFTAATMRSYLEHESNPLEVLQETHRILTDDGVLIVKVPNFACINRHVQKAKWCGFRTPDHVNYFTPKTLADMARKAGFSTHYGAMGALPTSDNMWAVMKKI